MSYPHNLYLHLVLTLGLVGAACVLFFLFKITWRTYKGVRLGRFDSEYQKGLVLLGVLLAIGFFVDQMKIEFVRHGTIDYVHFVFALFGIFLGLADRGISSAQRMPVANPNRTDTAPPEWETGRVSSREA